MIMTPKPEVKQHSPESGHLTVNHVHGGKRRNLSGDQLRELWWVEFGGAQRRGPHEAYKSSGSKACGTLVIL